jgi:1,4-alpha-glucan branching enzyme
MKKQVLKLVENETQEVTFKISAEVLGGAKKASIAGEFNNWDITKNPFKITKGVGSVKVTLEKGREYQYRFVINGETWVNDPSAAKQVANEFGEQNSVISL